jgi:hypothetical protein
MQTISDDRLEHRALMAYARKAAFWLKRGVSMPQPSLDQTEVDSCKGSAPVVTLRNCNGVLAKYLWTGARLKAI